MPTTFPLQLQVAERIKAKFGGLSDRELKEAIDEMFARVDEDGSGMIDVDELEVMVQEMMYEQ